jgi:hypothetical protein
MQRLKSSLASLGAALVGIDNSATPEGDILRNYTEGLKAHSQGMSNRERKARNPFPNLMRFRKPQTEVDILAMQAAEAKRKRKRDKVILLQAIGKIA